MMKPLTNAAAMNAATMNTTRVKAVKTPTIGPFRTPVRGHAFAGVPVQATVAGRRVLLVREPNNPADPLAVAVWVSLGASRWRLGYLDRAVAARVAPRMDAGAGFVGRIEGWVAEPQGRWRRPMVLLESADRRPDPAPQSDQRATTDGHAAADANPPSPTRTPADSELALAATGRGKYVAQSRQQQRSRQRRASADHPEADNLAARMPGVRRRIVSRAR